MTATFSADVPLKIAQRRLRELDQWLPIDGNPDTPLGQLVSENSSGALRLGYGAWRDLLLGVQFHNGRGELVTAGGRTVKNVAGYDLTKFMVGQHGVFGTLLTLTVRTYRRPDGALLTRYAPDSRLVNRLLPTPLRPQWALLSTDALLLGYLGDQPTLDYYRRSLPQTDPAEMTPRSLDDDVAHRAALWKASGPAAFRASIPPARIHEFIQNGHPETWVADAAFGIVLGNAPEPAAIEPLRAAAEATGGTLQTIADAFDFSTNPIERQIIERLKHAFDPDGKLPPLPRPSP